MATIQISEDLDRRLRQFTERTGQSREAFAAEALLSYIEDIEDLALATERLSDPGKRVSLAQLKRDLSIED